MATCLYNRKTPVARALLLAPTSDYANSADAKLMGDVQCFNAQFANDMVEERRVTFPPEIMRGMLAEVALVRSSAEVAALPPLALNYQRDWFAVTGRNVAVDEMGACIADTNPAGLFALLKTAPTSPQEGAAFAAIGRHLGKCLRAGTKFKPIASRFGRRSPMRCSSASIGAQPNKEARLMPKVTVDGIELEVPQGATVLQACELAGKEIPRFCYHERLSASPAIAGCAWSRSRPGRPSRRRAARCPPPTARRSAPTRAMVKKAREGVMEFLLINHPLDCPICDQGGECDLQDQAMAYGRGFSRFDENKRAVEDKYMGPVDQDRDDPLHPVHALHPLCRGSRRRRRDRACCTAARTAQITSYLERAVTSELSGNLVDLCPVGALLQKPQIFESAPVGAAPGAGDRRDGRGRHQHPPRRPPAPGDARAAAHQRGRERGVVSRQDAPPCRRPGARPARPAVGAREGQAARGELGRGARRLFAKRLKKAGPSVAAIAGDLLDAETMYAAKELLEGQGSTPARRPPDRARLRRHQPGGGALSTRPSPGSRTPTRSCWSAPTRAGKRRWSTRASARRSARAPRSSRSGRRSTWHARSNGLATISSCSASCPRRWPRRSQRPSVRR